MYCAPKHARAPSEPSNAGFGTRRTTDAASAGLPLATAASMLASNRVSGSMAPARPLTPRAHSAPPPEAGATSASKPSARSASRKGADVGAASSSCTNAMRQPGSYEDARRSDVFGSSPSASRAPPIGDESTAAANVWPPAAEMVRTASSGRPSNMCDTATSHASDSASAWGNSSCSTIAPSSSGASASCKRAMTIASCTSASWREQTRAAASTSDARRKKAAARPCCCFESRENAFFLAAERQRGS
mmetsp:Transcript_52179/g.174196  ORF Transcript_52179/g.174196 Transcript_52179/m.174196 type:complete len:247 (+) Transcript_52179:277-1017(+)